MGFISIKNWMGRYQRTPKEVARAIRYSGLGVRSVGPVGDFLDNSIPYMEHLGYNPTNGLYFLFILSSQMSRIWNGPVGDSFEKGCLFWVSKLQKLKGYKCWGSLKINVKSLSSICNITGTPFQQKIGDRTIIVPKKIGFQNLGIVTFRITTFVFKVRWFRTPAIVARDKGSVRDSQW